MVFSWSSCTFDTRNDGWWKIEEVEGGGEPSFGFTQLIYKKEEG